MTNVIDAFRNFSNAPNNGGHTHTHERYRSSLLHPQQNHRTKIQHERVKKKICFFFVLFLPEAQTCFAFTGELEGNLVSDLQVAEHYRVVTEKEYSDSCQIK